MKKGIIMKLFLITAAMLAGLCQAAMPLGLATTGTVFLQEADVRALQSYGQTREPEFTYITNNGTITITSYTGSNTTVDVPSMINNLPVTSIASNALAYSVPPANNANPIFRLTLPDSVTNLEARAIAMQPFVSIVLGAKLARLGNESLNTPVGESVYFKGDAPAITGAPFGDSITVYYLSGMTGFGTNFGGRPTAIWGPRVAASVIQNGTTNTPDQWGSVTLPSVTGASTNAPAWIAQTNATLSITLTNNLERPQFLFATGAVSLAFSGLRPPQPIYLIVKGPSSVTFPAGAHFVGGASWQTNAANHFIVWQWNTNLFINPTTTSEF